LKLELAGHASRIQSFVGLLPLCAATTFDAVLLTKYPEVQDRLKAFIAASPEAIASIHDLRKPGVAGRRLASILGETKLRRVLANIFLKDKLGRRPVCAGSRKFQEDPHWRDLILFYEYLSGDNGSGLGASHHTGRTGIVPRTLHLFATTTPSQALRLGANAAVTEV
jgi:hypothetical protein